MALVAEYDRLRRPVPDMTRFQPSVAPPAHGAGRSPAAIVAAFSYARSSPVPALRIADEHDPLEHEADAVASTMARPPVVSPRVSRGRPSPSARPLDTGLANAIEQQRG